jgi:hypothetical protein
MIQGNNEQAEVPKQLESEYDHEMTNIMLAYKWISRTRGIEVQ